MESEKNIFEDESKNESRENFFIEVSSRKRFLFLGGICLIFLVLGCFVYIFMRSEKSDFEKEMSSFDRQEFEVENNKNKLAEDEKNSGAFEDKDLSGSVESKKECSFDAFNFPEDYAIFLAGGYSGDELDFQIDQSGHMATKVEAVINYKEKPVVLVLGVYEPNIWDISWTKGTKIVGIYATGYHRQAVAGVYEEIPVLISTNDNNGACGYFHLNTDRMGGLNNMSRKLFGKDIDMVYPITKNEKVVIGEPVGSGDVLVRNEKSTIYSYKNSDDNLAGPLALEKLVEKGFLRKATREDADSWRKAIRDSKKDDYDDLPPVAGGNQSEIFVHMGLNPYFALKDFEIPSGLAGANSATFFIPKGISFGGERGHSTIYNFNNLECYGIHCNSY